MAAWVFWVIVAAIFAVGELLTMGFFLAPFAVGALAAALVDAIGGSFAVDIAAFVVVSVAVLTLLRPVARSHRRMPPSIRTGTAALVGRTGTVVTAIGTHGECGSVKIDGEIWSARALDEDQAIEAGTRVQVVEIKGAMALVTE
jgi:membrane protein implicated in regulation of membrane protease activity